MARILVVDDDEMSRLVIGRSLEDGGHGVVFAANGEDALERVRAQSFDAIVTDLAMPEINGLRLIKSLQELGYTLPVIAVSGKNADQLLLAEDYGAMVTLQKPIDRHELLAAVERTIHAEVVANRKAWF